MNIFDIMNSSDHKALEKLRATLFYIWLTQHNMIEKVGWEQVGCLHIIPHQRTANIHLEVLK